MGQGQQDRAIQQLRECVREGYWLCLKNLHLVTKWLPVLEKELNELEPHDRFRLWLMTEAHPEFSPVLLQNSLKVSYEAPQGFKKNLIATMESWGPAYLQTGDTTSSQARFLLAWFHAIVQERRSYMPQGWTKFYEFNSSDLRSAVNILETILRRGEGPRIQWEFLRGILETVVYGGKVDNPFDLRILITYLYQYFNSDVLTGSGRPHHSPIPGIQLPNSSDFQEYSNLIKSLPDTDTPEILTLPANIEGYYQRTISNQVVLQLRLLRRSAEQVTKLNREMWNQEMTPILNLWKKLNKGSTLHQMNVAIPSAGGIEVSPTRAFFTLEKYNAVNLVQKVHKSLSLLKKVIQGSILLSEDVARLADSLFKQQTPEMWRSSWEGPDDPVTYLRSLVNKAHAVINWVTRDEEGVLFKNPLDLGELFNPATFINALRQETARHQKTSLDRLKLVNWWSGFKTGNLPRMITVTGMNLEGAMFDGHGLVENEKMSSTVFHVPNFNLAWIPESEAEPYASQEKVTVPVYLNQNRKQLVTVLKMPCTEHPDKWIQLGTAMFLKS